MISPIVLAELSRGNPAHAAARLALVQDLHVLPLVPEVLGIAQVYVARKLMPWKPLGDAIHLAVASYYRCEFLVTWNYTHLANVNKYAHVRAVNRSLGLFVPDLVTPIQPVGGNNGEISPDG